LRLYRITVSEILLFGTPKPREAAISGSFGAQLEEGIENAAGRVRWKKVGGPMVNDDSPEAALSDLTSALKEFGGLEGYRQAVTDAKARAA
jgi:hypothetical protein